jgi:hypothetical protein
MAVIGVLPASGRASRIGGIPKFCLPISDEGSLLQWHVEQMLEVCDEVRVATRAAWVPIVESMHMSVKLMVREPSTMSDAIAFMVGKNSDTVVIGMPDTYILNSSVNIYKELTKEEDADIVIGAWGCDKQLKGSVGQVKIVDGKVVGSEDKVNNCDYPDMWGTMLFRRGMIRHLNPELDHPGKQLNDWITNGFDIRAVKPGGRYVDVGTIKGLKNLYIEIGNS